MLLEKETGKIYETIYMIRCDLISLHAYVFSVISEFYIHNCSALIKISEVFKCSSKSKTKITISGQKVCKFHCENRALRLNQVQSQ